VPERAAKHTTSSAATTSIAVVAVRLSSCQATLDHVVAGDASPPLPLAPFVPPVARRTASNCSHPGARLRAEAVIDRLIVHNVADQTIDSPRHRKCKQRLSLGSPVPLLYMWFLNGTSIQGVMVHRCMVRT
jgi:hypothetical protein